ncbi:hypothetical protein BKA56DRAFT_327831 [Ilyonectria sp. MPI-CAGE-AT-0026]|nr:hypothetical protein BKA56DRAFT_327831 [Ilyonectria sp. MPI-CAGE-AT-0026]
MSCRRLSLYAFGYSTILFCTYVRAGLWGSVKLVGGSASPSSSHLLLPSVSSSLVAFTKTRRINFSSAGASRRLGDREWSRSKLIGFRLLTS